MKDRYSESERRADSIPSLTFRKPGESGSKLTVHYDRRDSTLINYAHQFCNDRNYAIAFAAYDDSGFLAIAGDELSIDGTLNEQFARLVYVQTIVVEQFESAPEMIFIRAKLSTRTITLKKYLLGYNVRLF
jgi:hypothetical protein